MRQTTSSGNSALGHVRTCQYQPLGRLVFAVSLPVFLLSMLCTIADTIVPNVASGVWRKSGNPYRINEDAVVQSGDRLVIEPGTVVLFAPGVKLIVRGQLIADGTQEERIRFAPLADGLHWDRILMDLGSGIPSKFTFCDFSGARNALTFQIIDSDSTGAAEVGNCRFTDCIEFGVQNYAHGFVSQGLGGVYSYRPTLITSIKNSVFADCGGGCSYITEGSQSLLPAYGFVGNLVSGFFTNHNNIYHDIRGKAVALFAEAHTRTAEAKILNNTVQNASMGVDYANFTADIKNNIFDGCDTAIRRDVTSGETSYNNFYNCATNLLGYSSNFGEPIIRNRNGTPSDVAFNIFESPRFAVGSFLLSIGSPCIDAGDPNADFNETCFPPALGTPIADIGAMGGPLACNWPLPRVPPTVVKQPVSQKSCLGADVTFSIEANGSQPLNYQWHFNDVSILGATNPVYVVTGIQESNAGAYSVRVSNADGNLLSSEASLTIFDVCMDLKMYAGIMISGEEGATYELRFTTDMSNNNWVTWTSIATTVMPKAGWFYLDKESPFSVKRYYEARKIKP